MEEILAKFSIAHKFLQIVMGCDSNSHIDSDRTVSTDAFDFAFFQHAQEFGLHGERHIANFVQENGAVLRLLEFAQVPCACSGKGSLFVSK